MVNMMPAGPAMPEDKSNVRRSIDGKLWLINLYLIYLAQLYVKRLVSKLPTLNTNRMRKA